MAETYINRLIKNINQGTITPDTAMKLAQRQMSPSDQQALHIAIGKIQERGPKEDVSTAPAQPAPQPEAPAQPAVETPIGPTPSPAPAQPEAATPISPPEAVSPQFEPVTQTVTTREERPGDPQAIQQLMDVADEKEKLILRKEEEDVLAAEKAAKIQDEKRVAALDYKRNVDQTVNKYRNSTEEQLKYLSDEVNKFKQEKYENFWSRQSNGIKIASILMAGLGGAFGNDNILRAMDKVVEDDIAQFKLKQDQRLKAINAMKLDINEQQRYVREANASEDAKRVASYELIEKKLANIAANTKVKEIKFNADMAQQAIAEKKAKLAADAAGKVVTTTTQQMKRVLEQTGKLSDDEIGPFTDPIQQTSEQLSRFIRGFGLAGTEKQADRFREKATAGNSAIRELNKLIEIAEGVLSGKLDIEDRAVAGAAQSILMGKMRIPITGGGPLSKGDIELLERVAANPTELTQLLPLQKLNHLRDSIIGGIRDEGYAANISPKSMKAVYSKERPDPFTVEPEKLKVKKPQPAFDKSKYTKFRKDNETGEYEGLTRDGNWEKINLPGGG